MIINKSIILSFFIFSLIFLLIDFIWISIASKYIYRPNLPGILLDSPIIWPAILFYIIYSLGVTIIILKPALINNSISDAFWIGLLFGIVAYGTWSLTNMAILKGWSPIVTFIDMIWGGTLTSLTSAITIYLTNRIL